MSVIGLSQSAQFFRTYSQEVQEDVKTEIEFTARNIEIKAKSLAPGAGDRLATSYGSQENNTNLPSFIHYTISTDQYSATIGIDGQASTLAAYVEFGTGASAAGYVPTLPREWQEVARRYYINGKGTLIKKPFLLPAYFEYSGKLPENIRKILFDALR